MAQKKCCREKEPMFCTTVWVAQDISSSRLMRGIAAESDVTPTVQKNVTLFIYIVFLCLSILLAIHPIIKHLLTHQAKSSNVI